MAYDVRSNDDFRERRKQHLKMSRIRSISTSTNGAGFGGTSASSFQSSFDFKAIRRPRTQQSSVRSLIVTSIFVALGLTYWVLISLGGNGRRSSHTELMTLSSPRANRERFYDRSALTYFVEPLDSPSMVPSYEIGVDETGGEATSDGLVTLVSGLVRLDDDDNRSESKNLIDVVQPRTGLKAKNKKNRYAGGCKVEGMDEESKNEVNALLVAAVQYRDAGKRTKAQRLFEHALSVAPADPDVLTEYGVFMASQEQMIKADTMFTKALVICPHHQSALRNRERMAPLVEDIDNRMLHAIDDKRSYFLSIPRTNAALRRAMKDEYFTHVWHTVAIEGNTMNFVQTRSILETRMAVAGKSVIEHNEILGMDAALRYLNRTLVSRLGGITLNDIKAIHRRVLGFADPIQAGQFRNTQVYVGNFQPVHPSELEKEMSEFISWLNDDSSTQLHPVELAALAHYKFVYIHPFIDGNGRTSRLLMNLILMQAGFPPVSIRVEDRLEYYETLQAANDGDIRPFIRFIGAATDRTLQQYIDAVTVYQTSSSNRQTQTHDHDWQQYNDRALKRSNPTPSRTTNSPLAEVVVEACDGEGDDCDGEDVVIGA